MIAELQTGEGKTLACASGSLNIIFDRAADQAARIEELLRRI
ncbi:hypothetical protein AGMMS4952_23220 [Spirochaetia bacterium]|nr:hypothetical protein AGMMS4952_23220 [Spirochaetia bacterium]